MFISNETLNKGLIGIMNLNVDYGEAKLEAGEALTIRPERVKGEIKIIILTPMSQANIWVDSKTEMTFSVKSDKSTSFYWLVIGD
jgi:hypothetical protein